jgi:hypothetical protein
MGNESQLYREGGSISIDEMYDHLQEINKDKFNGSLFIKKEVNGISFIAENKGFYWWFQDTPHIKYENCNDAGDCDETPESDNYFDFMDCPSPDYLRWFQEIILKELISRTNLTCYIDCLGKTMEKTPYPETFYEFIHRGYFSENIIRRACIQKISK